MMIVSKALIRAIVHIDSRDVPDEIADGDVSVLEEVMTSLTELPAIERRRFLSVIEEIRDRETDPQRLDALESLHETLSDL